jgi:RimJ/RimL family protein N-acetyltransferase
VGVACEVVVRPATAADRDLVLAWANDPVTRARSFRLEEIDPAAHDTWFAARLADRHGRIWIGESAARPVGQVRVDGDPEGRGRVGITVAPEARGRGLAGPLLEAGMEAATKELGVISFIALVRPDNGISLRLFAAAGYVDEGPGAHAGVACRVLVWAGDPA